MDKIIEQIGKIGLVPVLTIDEADKAAPLAKALAAGGVPCAEVTFRTAQTEDAIRQMRAAVPELLVGAGTVLTVEQVDRAADAGAAFIVSPAFNDKVVEHCRARGLPVIPGCATPADLDKAVDAGLEVVKIFPAAQLGGPAFLKAVSAPYSSLRFIPTGGVNAANVGDYAAFPRTLACGGTWFAPKEAVSAGDWGRITDLCHKALMSLLGFKLLHIGVNAATKDEAAQAAKVFQTMFGFASSVTPVSVFAGDGVEIMAGNGRGTHGHIAIATWSVPKAIGFLERNGFEMDWPSAKKADDGHINFIYLKTSVLGFDLHLKEC
jgi:2-dehydro-3-deoxyphosphogluconate aldolase/(4S)-4-hydroxy-2-oxoglutarate aldolase